MGVVKEFGAESELIGLYQTYLVFVVLIGFISWLMPLTVGLAVTGEVLAAIVVASTTLAALLGISTYTLYWIRKFQESIKYVLEDDELIVTKGVWWKTKSVVPYNRITNVNTYQGPISRHFELGKLAIQTAGFSAANSAGKMAEAEIVGVKNFEEIKDIIMNFVKGVEPMAVEAKAEIPKNVNQEMLQELRRIRKAVEK
ncbi:MAG: PH domain-containing protein [Candidatus Bathyarchaeota archaeon]|nr:PH domain-containing protein [Candidatus Bathyarchaeota archaeon]